MTRMSSREVTVNLVLGPAVGVLGILFWVLGATGAKFGFLLPEYATTLAGLGKAVLALGLIWSVFAVFKRLVTP